MSAITSSLDLPRWKTPAGAAEFMAAYNAALELWPVPVEDLYLPTRWGRAHVLACGPREAPPLLLLHGFHATAAMWYPNAAALSRHFRVYAPDVVAQPGLTISTANIERRADLAEWLLDVLHGLGVEQADVAGLSYGGWMAVNLALYAPQVVKRLALLAPAGTVTSLRTRFMVYALPMIVLPHDLTIRPFFGWLEQGYRPDERFSRLMRLGVKHWHSGPTGVFPAAYSDDELRRLQPPTLLLIGDREVIYDPRQAFARAQRLIPRLKTGLIADACHLLNAEQADEVNARMLEFLGVESREAVPA